MVYMYRKTKQYILFAGIWIMNKSYHSYVNNFVTCILYRGSATIGAGGVMNPHLFQILVFLLYIDPPLSSALNPPHLQISGAALNLIRHNLMWIWCHDYVKQNEIEIRTNYKISYIYTKQNTKCPWRVPKIFLILALTYHNSDLSFF